MTDPEGAPIAAELASHGHVEPSAFRVAEKAYQLHKDQQMRIKKGGRRHGGKLVTRPTDLSQVIDLHTHDGHHAVRLVEVARAWATLDADSPAGGEPASSAQPPDTATAAAARPDGCPCSTSTTTSTSSPAGGGERPLRAYTLPRHPGLVVLPAAVAPEQQLRLMVRALCEYPEPPARTNHCVAHGPLAGVFVAAQRGLVCALRRRKAGSDPGDGTDEADACAACDSNNAAEPPAGGGGSSAAPAEDCGTPDACARGGGSGSSSGGGGGSASALRAPALEPIEHVPAFDECWGASGDGMPAAQMLRKLRWACLGPNFDWTRRAYVPHQPHRPLPPELAVLARRLYAAASAALHQTAAAAEAPHDDATRAGGSVADGPTITAAAAAAAAAASSFHPDAALVNYYHEGDTLGGHRDDAERDQTQPIVTVSLGCDAVFLVGGDTKEVAPTALLLRSGDVVVMAGAARRAYHGLPRILSEHPLPAGVLAAAEAAAAARDGGPAALPCGGWQGSGTDDLWQRCVRHMQACRVNISIRSTR